MSAPLEYIDVPADTSPAQCRGASCKATIYWIERLSKNKKTPDKIVRIPVDCEYNEQCSAPVSGANDGLGVNHFQTCPDANRF